MKTAISLTDTLFRDADHLAAEEHVTRSELFARALKEYIERRRHQDIFHRINEAYDDDLPTSEEKKLKKQSRRYYVAKILRREQE